MVEAGFGLAVLPTGSVTDELRAGTLRVLPVAAMQTTIPVILVHRRHAFHGATARALLTLLLEGLRVAEGAAYALVVR